MGNHGDAGLVEDAMIQLHHLHASTVAAPDLLGQLLPENWQVFAIRRANMRRNIFLSTILTLQRSKPEQVRKLACCEPRHSAAVVHSAERQPSVTFQACQPRLAPSSLSPAMDFTG